MSSINSLGNVFQNAQLGISRGVEALNRDAAVIASSSATPAGSEDLTAALIDMSQQKALVQMSAKALAIADETLTDVMGTLVDTHA